MSQDIRQFVTPSCQLLALGEPTHREPAFARIRNELLVQLVDRGFRSVAIETDRVAALAVNDFVQHGVGTLDAALRDGFSHTFGDLAGNRDLVAWMRDHNERRPVAERLAFHGFDAPTEMMSAPSPLSYVEYASDYLGLELDLAGLAGGDERWSGPEAIMDAASSVGATAEADRLRAIADDLLGALYQRAPELIAASSRAAWFRARTHLTAGLGLLRYHRQAARDLDQSARVSNMLATRDAIMAENLLDIRTIEARRGPTLVFAQNLHLRRNLGYWRLADLDVVWAPAGSIVGSLVGDQYTFVAGSLGRSDALRLGEPDVDTYEGLLRYRFDTWGLTPAAAVPAARTRTDTTPAQGYFPLDQATLDGADAILHVTSGSPVPAT